MSEPAIPTGSGPFGYSLSQFQNLIDTTSSLQPHGHVNASVYGWVSGTRGVWVLETPTDEQRARLSTFPRTDDQEVFNGYLQDVGAVFYADYDDNEGAKEMMSYTTNFSHREGRRGGREGRQGLEGMVIDGEETRRRNDGRINLRHADTH